MRRSPLKRRSPLRTTRRRPKLDEWALAYKRVEYGRCEVCGMYGLVRRHHVTYQRHVEQAGGDPWDTRNAMWVGLEGVTCNCHSNHHAAGRRIPVSKIPEEAVAFAAGLFGERRAVDYFLRYYSK